MTDITILHGDCLLELPKLPAASIDAIITDPPYNLVDPKQRSTMQNKTWVDPQARQFQRLTRGFMSQHWDHDIAFHREVWAECWRVLKPGGHLCAFGGSRTHHRLWCAIEDAGFELRDCLFWLYFSGFPKSLDISKAIDQKLGATRAVVGEGPYAARRPSSREGVSGPGYRFGDGDLATAPATPEAAQWAGWQSALKPAYEPILLARRPLDGTLAENTLAHGVGGLNIDATRVASEPWAFSHTERTSRRAGIMGDVSDARQGIAQSHPAGRWPPNLLHDGSPELLELFDQYGAHGGGYGVRGAGPTDKRTAYQMPGQGQTVGYGDDPSSAARFFPALGYDHAIDRTFYCPKAARADRAGSRHPTVKPIRLLEWLCRLIVPPGGRVLDPFAGSGTTGVAAQRCELACTLIEAEAAYVADIRRRFY